MAPNEIYVQPPKTIGFSRRLAIRKYIFVLYFYSPINA